MAIAPEYGCNMFSWKVDGREILFRPDDFGKRADGYFAGGNPILYPSVGRTWDRSGGKPVADMYRIHGEYGEYSMPCHGILLLGNWSKTAEKIEKGCVQVEYTFSPTEKTMSENYPFDTAFSLKYTLEDFSVKIEASLRNNGTCPAPFALGCHPYFRVADRNSASIRLPCEKRVLLDPRLLIPTGEEKLSSSILTFENARTYDMAFCGMDGKRASVVNNKSGTCINVDFDENIEMLVVYSGSGSDFICLEPWTRGLGAYETLKHKGWAECGEIPVLQPGEVKRISLKYSIENGVS